MKATAQNRGRRLLRSPGLHFLLLGSALYLGEGWLARADVEMGEGPTRVLNVGPARVDQLSRQWQATYRKPPTAQEEDWLLRQWIEDEILYREALAVGLDRGNSGVCYRLVLNMHFLGLDSLGLDGDVAPEARKAGLAPQPAEADWWTLCAKARELGLDRDDPVIRRQMAATMRILLRRSAPPEEASRQDLEDYVARHPDRFHTPSRIRWSHVFLSRDRRGEVLSRDAQRLLNRLVVGVAPEAGKATVDPEQAAELGDPLPTGDPPELPSQRNLARRLGTAFARDVMELPEKRWSGPLRSAFGLHLVWIHERLPAELRPWQEIEEKAIQGLESERSEKRYAAALEQLLGRWEISRPEAESRGDEA